MSHSSEEGKVLKLKFGQNSVWSHSQDGRTPFTLSIVLPCFNEQDAVHLVLDRIDTIRRSWGNENLRLHEVIVVDDGSVDQTIARVQQWLETHPEFTLRLIQHEVRKGYGAALKTGIGAASGDVIAFYDVDGTYDPGQIPMMIREMRSLQASMACGDRLSQCLHMPLTREIGNRLFVGTINLLYGTRVFDSCTGMRVFPRSMQTFFSSSELPDGLDYSLAMTLAFLSAGQSLVEVPIPYSRRIGRSKLKVLTDGPRFFVRIVTSWILRRRDSRLLL